MKRTRAAHQANRGTQPPIPPQRLIDALYRDVILLAKDENFLEHGKQFCYGIFFLQVSRREKCVINMSSERFSPAHARDRSMPPSNVRNTPSPTEKTNKQGGYVPAPRFASAGDSARCCSSSGSRVPQGPRQYSGGAVGWSSSPLSPVTRWDVMQQQERSQCIRGGLHVDLAQLLPLPEW